MPFSYDLSGTLLDRRYQISRQVGKGGMGHVYEAIHVALEQRVAIKVLHPRYAHEEKFRERFLREARAASKIRHRSVVRITDFGDTPDGSVYFVMEFLDGHDLGAELRNVGAMKWPRARHILLQAAGALRAAHAQKIIHRDVKPANIFLTVDKEEGLVDFVKVLDFGIAKVATDSHSDERGRGLTGTGEVFGTVAYMSPEQAGGAELDPRSDMYSLGIVAYEMLTGSVPFVGANSIHIITQHMYHAPEPLRSHDPSIPEAVEKVVLKALAKEPQQRYGSLGDLEHALRSIPEAAQPPPRRTQFWRGPGKGKEGEVRVRSGTLNLPDPSARPPEVVREPPTAAPDARPVGAAQRRAFGKTARSNSAEVAAVPTVAVPPTDVAPPHPSGPRSVTAVPIAPDGTNPPPSGRDQAMPGATSWGPDLSSTGPLTREGDSSAETSPHSLSGSGVIGLSARTVALLAGLVVLVGAGSALATVAYLAGRGNEGETASERNAADVRADVRAEPAAKGNEVEEPPPTPVPSPPTKDEPMPSSSDPEPVATVASGDGSDSEIAIVEVTPSDGGDEAGRDGVVDGNDGGDDEVTTPVEDPPRSSIRPVAEPPSVPKHETASCIEARKAVEQGVKQQDWKAVRDNARKRPCWPPAEQADRQYKHVLSLAELKLFDECVKAGKRPSSDNVKNLVEGCEKRR